jgi:SAM-dependent methyltransferase
MESTSRIRPSLQRDR